MTSCDALGRWAWELANAWDADGPVYFSPFLVAERLCHCRLTHSTLGGPSDEEELTRYTAATVQTG